MSLSNEKKYHIDDVAASVYDLIEQANYISESFNIDNLKSTSAAARVLRDAGHVVGYIDEIPNE